MSSYFLDSSVVVECLRSKQNIQDLVDSLPGTIVSSFICLSELYEGVFRVGNKEKTEAELENFFKGLDEIYNLDISTAREFGRLRAELKKKGKVIEDIDIFIAATCIAHNLELVTLNSKHFKRVEGLRIYSF